MDGVIQRYLSKNIDMLILGLIKENEMDSLEVSGYGIALQLLERHKIMKHTSALYSILSRLERDGLLFRTRALRKRTTYKITETGEKLLTRYVENLLKYEVVRRIVKRQIK